MRIFKLIKNLILGLYTSIKRFPTSIGLSACATILLIILTHYDMDFGSSLKEQITRASMVLILGIPISLCIKLLFERLKSISFAAKTVGYLIFASILVLYYYFLLENMQMIAVSRYVGISIAFYLIFLCIPYFYRKGGFELYVIKLLTRFFVTTLFSVILFSGIAIILFTIDKLLGVNIQYKIYLDIWMGVIGIFAPCFFLAGVPLHSQYFEAIDYPKLLKEMLLYIVMPLIVAYSIILYLYFVKIIITLKWPVGMVANLVLWYGVVSVIVFFLTTPLRDGNSWAKSFTFWLSKLIIPLTLMMFVSIGIRVKAYGITENRYYEGKVIYKSKISEFTQKIYKKYAAVGKSSLSIEKASFDTENERVKLKFIIQNMSGEEDSTTGEIKINSLDLFTLISIK